MEERGVVETCVQETVITAALKGLWNTLIKEIVRHSQLWALNCFRYFQNIGYNYSVLCVKPDSDLLFCKSLPLKEHHFLAICNHTLISFYFEKPRELWFWLLLMVLSRRKNKNKTKLRQSFILYTLMTLKFHLHLFSVCSSIFLTQFSTRDTVESILPELRQ